MVTGLEVHGSFSLMGFERAVLIHNTCGIIWAVAFAFFVFWIYFRVLIDVLSTPKNIL